MKAYERAIEFVSKWINRKYPDNNDVAWYGQVVDSLSRCYWARTDFDYEFHAISNILVVTDRRNQTVAVRVFGSSMPNSRIWIRKLMEFGDCIIDYMHSDYITVILDHLNAISKCTGCLRGDDESFVSTKETVRYANAIIDGIFTRVSSNANDEVVADWFRFNRP